MNKYQIIKYLKDNNLWRKYINNCLIYYKNGHREYDSLMFLVRNKIQGNLICGVFSWDSTKEGYDFWNKAGNDFIRWYHENKN